jgi:hypothetical protein
MERKWNTVIAAKLKRLFVGVTYMSCCSQRGYISPKMSIKAYLVTDVDDDDNDETNKVSIRKIYTIILTTVKV